MALPNSNISTSLVKTTIGASTNNVGALCTHPNINKWSKWKPVRSNKVSGLTVTDIENISSGLSRLDMYEVVYLKPTGGASSPYRLGDFRNYNHSAIPPVVVEVLDILELQTGELLTTAPFVLLYNYIYRIRFRLPIGGEIDPSTIHPRTVRTKNTIGDGGLSWVSGIDNEVTRVTGEVFTAPSGTTSLNQDLTILPNSLLPPLRLQYCTYDEGIYRTLPYAVEDSSYMDNFQFTYLDMTLSLNTRWDGLAGSVVSTLTVVNNMNKSFLDMRASYTYTINGGSQMFATGYLSIPASTTVNNTVNLNTANPGVNSYAVSVKLESREYGTNNWLTMLQTNRTQSITIPN